jgi:hypothetical protein
MNAKEARAIADDRNVNLAPIFLAIKEAAEKGEYKIRVHRKLNQREVYLLRQAGYSTHPLITNNATDVLWAED